MSITCQTRPVAGARLTLAIFLMLLGPVPALAVDPARIYTQRCAACHEGGVPKAPHSITFPLLGSQAIFAALTQGPMQAQGAALSPQQRRELAEFLGGSVLETEALPDAPKCSGESDGFDTQRPPAFDGPDAFEHSLHTC